MLRLLTSRATMFALLAVVVWAAVLVAPARGADGEHGYLLATSGGDVVAFGDFDSRSFELQSSAVSMAATSDGTGVVLVEPDGTLHAQGSVAVRDMVDTAAWDAGEQASAIVATPANDGFWVVTTAGRVHQLGDAPALGDVSSLDLSSPITAASATLDGGGLYLIGADGGIFALGTAEFWGSVPQVLPGVVLDAPVVGLAPSPSGLGYWLVASDGGLFSFGDAAFQGSIPQVLPGVTLNAQVVGAVPYGDGYLMVGADGGVFNFSNLSFLGSLGADPPADPVVSVVPVSRNGGDIATSSTSSTPTSTSTTTSTSTSSTTSTSTTSTTSTSTTSTSTTSTSTTSTSTTSTSTTSTSTTTTSTTAPAGGNATITVWHDTTPDFAYLGVPQRWGNVMGKVTDPQGVDEVDYRLNGGSWVSMQTGADVRRLTGAGHFNIDLLLDDLNVGQNTVTIRVTDDGGGTTTKNVTVRKGTGPNWSLPTTVDWSSQANITDLAQPVDGWWRVVGGKLNNVDDGYDRIIAIGDTDWTDYEVEMTVRYNSIHSNANSWPSYGPGVGFAMRWNGHNNTVDPGAQPLVGFKPDGVNPTPFGAVLFWRDRSTGPEGFELYDHDNTIRDSSATTDMDAGETWIFKARVSGSGSTTYSFKAWQQGTTEPAGWTLQHTVSGDPDAPGSGSLALIAHEVDAVFGDVVISAV